MVHWQCYKDPMHAYDHGVAMHITQTIVKTIHKLEVDLGLPKKHPVAPTHSAHAQLMQQP